MAKQQHELQPIVMEHDQDTSTKDINLNNNNKNNNTNYDYSDTSPKGCFSSLFCCFESRHNDSETAGFLYQPTGDFIDQDNWFMKRAKSVKEYSELVAGPKWKNFIRRFSKKPKTRSHAYQYDPQSYALNFNDALDIHEDDDDLLPRSFSTRYAPPTRSSQL